MEKDRSYSMFADFIKKYSGTGFININNSHPFMKQMNKKLDHNRQFFFIADLLKLQILYTSPQIENILGLKPETVDPKILVSNTDPNEVPRLSRGFNILVAKARELFINKSGSLFISSNFRKMKTNGEYIQFLMQVYLFFNPAPFETVYALEVCTPVDYFPDILNGRNHWYIGNDSTYFRYPDKELLSFGSGFTNRELEIIQNISKGMKSKEIAEKLFLSPATIFTHRKNILKKCGKSTISQVIFDLNQRGII